MRQGNARRQNKHAGGQGIPANTEAEQFVLDCVLPDDNQWPGVVSHLDARRDSRGAADCRRVRG